MNKRAVSNQSFFRTFETASSAIGQSEEAGHSLPFQKYGVPIKLPSLNDDFSSRIEVDAIFAVDVQVAIK